MKSSVQSVGVFLSSSDRVSAHFLEEAERLGARLAKEGFSVVYGGASCGCMGALAKGVKAEKGPLIGVVPEIDILTEVVEEDLTEKILVPSMSARKEHMMERSDAFVIFPGGVGTLDEVTDVLCLKALNSSLTKDKPVAFYNYMGFWDPFIESLEIMNQQRMVSSSLDRMYQVFSELEEVIGFICDS
jgi:uncharacterized protein (TIGR00730 family)